MKSNNMANRPLSTVPAAQRVIVTNEQVTGPPAMELIRQSGILDDVSNDIRVLDNATGGGILVSELLKHQCKGRISSIIAGDINEQMLAYSRRRGQTEQWDQSGVGIEISNLDQESPNLGPDSLDYVFNNFGIFFSKDDTRTLSQTRQILKPNGKSIFSSWRRISWWTSVVIPAMQRYLPDAPQLPDPMSLFPDAWNNSNLAESKLTAAGFRNVTTKVYSFVPDVGGAEFAEACAVLAGAAAKRAWAEDEFSRFGPEMEDAFREYLMETYPGGRWNESMLALITMGEK